jgi:hypothetical protein
VIKPCRLALSGRSRHSTDLFLAMRTNWFMVLSSR